MGEVNMNGIIMRALSRANDWMSFDQLDRAVAAEAPYLKQEVRRSLLRGEIGRMLQAGSIARQKNRAFYKISDETINLFTQENVKQ